MKRCAMLVSLAVLIGFPLVLYSPFLFGDKVLYWGVYLLQFYPWRQLAVDQIRAGYWPLWNPYLGAGTPLAANLQTAAFYPPNILFLLMPIERAFGWELALHLALAGLSTYYLARTLGLSRPSALVSALAYGGGGYMVARWVFPSMVCAAAWLPLMLALTERLLCRAADRMPQSGSSPTAGQRVGGPILDAGLLALVIGLQLLAGHAQTSFYSLLIVCAFALVRAIQGELVRGRLRAWRLLRSLGTLLLALLWGFALAAIQMVPSAELAAHSHRPGALTDLQFAYELSFWPWRLITLLAPDFFGNPARGGYWAYGTYWEEAAFVGVLPLLLALFALIGWWRRRRASPAAAARRRPADDRPCSSLVPFWAGLSLVSILLALGSHTPLYPILFRLVPGWGWFQGPARLLVGYALGVALLAGIGLETLVLTPRTKTALRWTVVVGLGVGIAGLAVRLALPGVRPSFGESTARLGLTLSLAAAVLVSQGRRLRRGPWTALVVGLVAADLLAFGWGLTPGTAPVVFEAPVTTAEFLRSQPPGRVHVALPYAQATYDEYVSLHSFGSSEPAHLQSLRESLLPNLSAVHHLPGIGNYDPLAVGVFQDLWDHLEGSQKLIDPLLNIMGARYIISGGDPPLPLPLAYVDPRGPLLIYRNEGALPAAFVVPNGQVVQDEEARLALLSDPAFDPRDTVLLSESPPQAPQSDVDPSGPASREDPWVVRRGPNRIMISADLRQAGYLVLTETHYPGWRATVDGQRAEILAANHAFRAVRLEPGRHIVLFEYRPLSIYLGAGTTLVAGLLLVAAGIARWLRRREA